MQNVNKIKNWTSTLIPPALIVFSVLSSNLSENDKAPILIFTVIGIDAVIFIFSGLYLLFNKNSLTSLRFLFIGSALTLIYIIIAIFLSRAGIVDSIYLLGFR